MLTVKEKYPVGTPITYRTKDGRSHECKVIGHFVENASEISVVFMQRIEDGHDMYATEKDIEN